MLLENLRLLNWDISQNIHNLNRGGCCVFAAKVAEELEKRKIPVRILVGQPKWTFGNEMPAITKIRHKIASNTGEEWNKHNVLFYHVIVEFKYDGETYHYDSESIDFKKKTMHLGDYVILKAGLKIKEAGELAGNWENWNRTFNRDQIPKLHKIIEKHLKNI